MAEEKSAIQDTEIELLMLNHKSLHDSIWNNHRVSWLVTSIFIPVLFAMLGYLIREYDDLSKFQIAMGFWVTEGLLCIWLLIMRIFEHYNKSRIEKLKKLENKLNKMVQGVNFELYQLHYEEVPREFKFSPTRIYYTLFGLYTALNIGLLVAKLISG